MDEFAHDWICIYHITRFYCSPSNSSAVFKMYILNNDKEILSKSNSIKLESHSSCVQCKSTFIKKYVFIFFATIPELSLHYQLLGYHSEELAALCSDKDASPGSNRQREEAEE